MMNKSMEDKLLNVLSDEEVLKQLEHAQSIDKDIEIAGLIFKTKNYDKFKLIKENRPLNQKNIKKLRESIRRNGYKISNPIIVNRRGEILNGQHREFICEENGIPLYFTLDDSENNLKLMVDLQIQEDWKLYNFITSYTKLGVQDYINFSNMTEDEDISVSLGIWLLYSSRNGDVQAEIRMGKLKCTEEDVLRVKECLLKIREIRDVIPNKLKDEKNLRKKFKTEKICVPLMCIMKEKNYSHKRMLKQVQECYYSIKYQNMFDAGDSFVNIYNYRLNNKSGKRLRSYEEIGKILC